MKNNSFPPFYIGQKVVMVSAIKTPLNEEELTAGVKYPIKGKIYTVRELVKLPYGWHIKLNEIINPPCDYEEGFDECSFHVKRFTPVQKQKPPLMTFTEIKEKEKEEILILN